MFGQTSLVVKSKLESVIERLGRLCSEKGSDSAVRDEHEQERRVNLFKWVSGITPTRGCVNPLSALSG